MFSGIGAGREDDPLVGLRFPWFLVFPHPPHT